MLRLLSGDTTLDPGRTYGAIIVRRSGVTVDGNGAWLIGTPADSRAAGVKTGVVGGLLLDHVSRSTLLRNRANRVRDGGLLLDSSDNPAD